jgi:hypothetical protein
MNFEHLSTTKDRFRIDKILVWLYIYDLKCWKPNLIKKREFVPL